MQENHWSPGVLRQTEQHSETLSLKKKNVCVYVCTFMRVCMCLPKLKKDQCTFSYVFMFVNV
jgi:hypothetical protein